jgi:hypothetical protein
MTDDYSETAPDVSEYRDDRSIWIKLARSVRGTYGWEVSGGGDDSTRILDKLRGIDQQLRDQQLRDQYGGDPKKVAAPSGKGTDQSSQTTGAARPITHQRNSGR